MLVYTSEEEHLETWDCCACADAKGATSDETADERVIIHPQSPAPLFEMLLSCSVVLYERHREGIEGGGWLLCLYACS